VSKEARRSFSQEPGGSGGDHRPPVPGGVAVAPGGAACVAEGVRSKLFNIPARNGAILDLYGKVSQPISTRIRSWGTREPPKLRSWKPSFLRNKKETIWMVFTSPPLAFRASAMEGTRVNLDTIVWNGNSETLYLFG